MMNNGGWGMREWSRGGVEPVELELTLSGLSWWSQSQWNQTRSRQGPRVFRGILEGRLVARSGYVREVKGD